MIARLRGELRAGPRLFDVLSHEDDVTPRQAAFVRTMLEGVDADIFKASGYRVLGWELERTLKS
jgi:hypothetical protein